MRKIVGTADGIFRGDAVHLPSTTIYTGTVMDPPNPNDFTRLGRWLYDALREAPEEVGDPGRRGTRTITVLLTLEGDRSRRPILRGPGGHWWALVAGALACAPQGGDDEPPEIPADWTDPAVDLFGWYEPDLERGQLSWEEAVRLTGQLRAGERRG